MREPTTGELTHFHAQGGVDVYTASGRLKLARDQAGNELEITDAIQWLVEHGRPFRHVVSERASLETVFHTLTGRSLRD